MQQFLEWPTLVTKSETSAAAKMHYFSLHEHGETCPGRLEDSGSCRRGQPCHDVQNLQDS
ncbi:hypothetical protein A7E75_09965 [Syntrophotalea acetylenica]|uniref:Uncharacterized protein n=1 Tax=Syntrophotalea acetylenica TaxID=29542 RepID=A0A1L3GH82_SYNAC|nr:hypothetical protein A7E75_09965 [Syntrophotalea acetylenica]APG43371.1 hypothetical protein A6070_03965 [Syntrophotalea acetylenica]